MDPKLEGRVDADNHSHFFFSWVCYQILPEARTVNCSQASYLVGFQMVFYFLDFSCLLAFLTCPFPNITSTSVES